MDEAVGCSAEAEDGADQEGDGSPERQARCPESQRCEENFFSFFSIRTNYLPGEPYTNAREAGKRKDPS